MAGGVSTDVLRQTLQDAFQPTNLVVFDTSDGCGSKFQVYVASQQFVGKTLIERHRMVNEAVKPHMDRIHAIEIKPWLPEQWEAKKSTIPQHDE